jgi:hypothetical protein
MTRIALVVTYLLGMAVAAVLMDADGGGWWGTIWLVASVLLGAGTGDYRLALLSVLTIPIAIPLGLPADGQGDPVLPVWAAMVYFAPFSSALILLSAFVRRIAQSRLRRRRARRDSQGGLSRLARRASR